MKFTTGKRLMSYAAVLAFAGVATALFEMRRINAALSNAEFTARSGPGVIPAAPRRGTQITITAPAASNSKTGPGAPASSRAGFEDRVSGDSPALGLERAIAGTLEARYAEDFDEKISALKSVVYSGGEGNRNTVMQILARHKGNVNSYKIYEALFYKSFKPEDLNTLLVNAGETDNRAAVRASLTLGQKIVTDYPPENDAQLGQVAAIFEQHYTASDETVRAIALRAGSKLQKPDVRTITDALQDTGTDVRISALHIIEDQFYDMPEMVDAVMKLARNTYETQTVRSAALSTLSSLDLDDGQQTEYEALLNQGP